MLSWTRWYIPLADLSTTVTENWLCITSRLTMWWWFRVTWKILTLSIFAELLTSPLSNSENVFTTWGTLRDTPLTRHNASSLTSPLKTMVNYRKNYTDIPDFLSKNESWGSTTTPRLPMCSETSEKYHQKTLNVTHTISVATISATWEWKKATTSTSEESKEWKFSSATHWDVSKDDTWMEHTILLLFQVKTSNSALTLSCNSMRKALWWTKSVLWWL